MRRNKSGGKCHLEIHGITTRFRGFCLKIHKRSGIVSPNQSLQEKYPHLEVNVLKLSEVKRIMRVKE